MKAEKESERDCSRIFLASLPSAANQSYVAQFCKSFFSELLVHTLRSPPKKGGMHRRQGCAGWTRGAESGRVPPAGCAWRSARRESAPPEAGRLRQERCRQSPKDRSRQSCVRRLAMDIARITITFKCERPGALVARSCLTTHTTRPPRPSGLGCHPDVFWRNR